MADHSLDSEHDTPGQATLAQCSPDDAQPAAEHAAAACPAPANIVLEPPGARSAEAQEAQASEAQAASGDETQLQADNVQPSLAPEDELRAVISQAQCELSALNLHQLSQEELEAAALEEALMMHQMQAQVLTQQSKTPQPALLGRRSVSPGAMGMARQKGPQSRTDSPVALLGLLHAAEPSGDVQVETEVQKFQTRIKQTVARDIQKMLMSSKAYVKHYSEPPKISQAQLTSLAKPRPGTLHPDTELALLEADADYTEYAKRKASQLCAARRRSEARAVEAAEEARHLQGQLHHYKEWKQAREDQKKAILAQEAQAQHEYGKQMAIYLKQKALAELQEIKAKREESKKRKPQASTQLPARLQQCI